MDGELRGYASNHDYLFKIILIGDSGVGKTSILAQFVGEEVVKSHISTIGIDFKMKTLSFDGKQVKVQIWDTAGQERYETITTQYYRRAQGIILAYDITRKASFNSIRKWLRYVEEFAEHDVKLTLIGNKLDLIEQRDVSVEEAEELAKDFNIPWFETSAYTGENVNDAFLTVAKQIYVDVVQKEERETTIRRQTSIVEVLREDELTSRRNNESSKCNC